MKRYVVLKSFPSLLSQGFRATSVFIGGFVSARTWCKSEISKERAQKWGVLFIGIWIPAIVAFLLIKPDRDILQYLGTKPSGNNRKGLLFAYDVGFGIEGNVLSVIVLIIACTLIYLWGRKHKAVNG